MTILSFQSFQWTDPKSDPIIARARELLERVNPLLMTEREPPLTRVLVRQLRSLLNDAEKVFTRRDDLKSALKNAEWELSSTKEEIEAILGQIPPDVEAAA